MTPRRKKRLLIASALIAGSAGFFGLLVFAFNQNIDLFYTPSEIINGKGEQGIKPQIGQRLRVGGLVLPGSLLRATDSLKVSFELTDKDGGIVTVEYGGILPDLFREGQGIVANGVLTAPRYVKAHEVLAKHDENYMPPEVAEALKGMQHFKPEYTEQQLQGSGFNQGGASRLNEASLSSIKNSLREQVDKNKVLEAVSKAQLDTVTTVEPVPEASELEAPAQEQK